VRFRALQQFFARCLDEAELGRARTNHRRPRRREIRAHQTRIDPTLSWSGSSARQSARRCAGQDLPPETAREQLIAAWGNAAFVDARLNAWRTFVDSPERVADTVERLVDRPAHTFRSWADEHADGFR
jgi:alkanesulfonate monooxygenase SsuD/methylene tetrahydromethanopterin reductase-like flavin-dependent oxidoreductase (luciferase family)